MAYIPKYEKVKNQLLSDIRNGVYETGQRIPTREQLIEKYQVTRTTINHALKELVEGGVLVTSKRGGTVVTGRAPVLRLAYVTSHADSSKLPLLGKEETDKGPMLHPLLAKSSVLNLTFIDTDTFSADIGIAERFDLVAVSMPSDDLMSRMRQYREKFVIINRIYDNINFISTDHRAAVREMTQINLERTGGNCQIFFLLPPNPNFVLRERRDGFVDACAANKSFYRMVELKSDNYDNIFDKLMAIDFEAGRPIVMVSPSLSYTGAVLKMIVARGLEFNRDIFYSDFDNADAMRNTGYNILSAVQNYRAMGEKLAEIFEAGITENIREYIPYRLTL